MATMATGFALCVQEASPLLLIMPQSYYDSAWDCEGQKMLALLHPALLSRYRLLSAIVGIQSNPNGLCTAPSSFSNGVVNFPHILISLGHPSFYCSSIRTVL